MEFSPGVSTLNQIHFWLGKCWWLWVTRKKTDDIRGGGWDRGWVWGTDRPVLHFILLFFYTDHFQSLSKSLLNLLQYCSVSCFGFLGLETCGILASRPEMEPAPPTLEGEVLTTGPPRSPTLLDFKLVLLLDRTCKLLLVGDCKLQQSSQKSFRESFWFWKNKDPEKWASLFLIGKCNWHISFEVMNIYSWWTITMSCLNHNFFTIISNILYRHRALPFRWIKANSYIKPIWQQENLYLSALNETRITQFKCL